MRRDIATVQSYSETGSRWIQRLRLEPNCYFSPSELEHEHTHQAPEVLKKTRLYQASEQPKKFLQVICELDLNGTKERND